MTGHKEPTSSNLVRFINNNVNKFKLDAIKYYKKSRNMYNYSGGRKKIDRTL